MSKYVDGFVLPIPKDRIEEYRRFEEKAWAIWRDHGALSLTVCLSDDVPAGKLTSFPRSVDMKDDEIVALAWIVYESREHRDRVNAAAMSDPRMAGFDHQSMPFDGMRMFWGGFSVAMELAGSGKAT